MKIKIDKSLRFLQFWALEEEIPKVAGVEMAGKKGLLIYTFRKPKLLVDTAAIARLDSVKRDLLMRLLEFNRRVTSYDGVDVEWSDIKYPGVWSPSIDTILFAKALNLLFSRKEFRNKIGTFLEIGCGSGFLSKYVLRKKEEAGRPITHAELMDINQDALNCAMTAIKPVQNSTLVSYALNIADRPIRVSHPYDLVMCNPPYIPRPHASSDNPFEGLFLYGEILDKARKLLSPNGSLITNFSSTSKSDVYPAFEKIFRIKTLAKMKVPLKIPLITACLSEKSKNWMKYLIENGRLITDTSEKSGYRYWQFIEIAECRFK